MPVDYEYRYRQAINIAQRAEREVNRLKKELVEQKAATEAMTIIAEEALSALEIIGSRNQA